MATGDYQLSSPMNELTSSRYGIAPVESMRRKGQEMKAALFHVWGKVIGAEEERPETREIAVRVLEGGDPVTVTVAGRVTVDTSPHLRSILLRLIRRRGGSTLVIDAAAVSYVDMSGVATLLEALKAACKRSVKLRLAGMSGQARALAEMAELEKVFSAWGAEVEFR